MHRIIVTRALAVLVVAGVLGGSATIPAVAADRSPAESGWVADPDGRPAGADEPAPPAGPRGYVLLPTDVRVDVDETGFTVTATPRCTVFAKTCSAWIQVPGVVDAKEVATVGGYFVAWPSSVAEGATVHGGEIRGYARDGLGYGWYTRDAVGLGAITRPVSPRGLTAQPSSQDDSVGSVVVAGTATPGASIRRDGAVVATADPRTGAWSTTVTGLPFGTSELVFQQVVGGTLRDTATVQVTRRSAALLEGVSRDGGELSAGRDDEVDAVFVTRAPLTGPLDDATVTFTAPAGARLAPTSTSIRGQYRLPGDAAWRDFAQVQLTDGTVTGDGSRVVYRWRSSAGTSLPTGAEIRFRIPVTAPQLSAGFGTLGAVAVGDAPQGRFDTTASTTLRWSVAGR